MQPPVRDERGSALMLIPAGVLVLLVLAAIALDSAVIFMAHRELNNRAAGAANDIAAMLVDDESFYRDGGAIRVVDEGAADRYVASVFDPANPPAGFARIVGEATLDGTRRVIVEAEGDVRWIFAAAIPGLKGVTTVRVEAEATTVGG